MYATNRIPTYMDPNLTWMQTAKVYRIYTHVNVLGNFGTHQTGDTPTSQQ